MPETENEMSIHKVQAQAKITNFLRMAGDWTPKCLGILYRQFQDELGETPEEQRENFHKTIDNVLDIVQISRDATDVTFPNQPSAAMLKDNRFLANNSDAYAKSGIGGQRLSDVTRRVTDSSTLFNRVLNSIATAFRS